MGSVPAISVLILAIAVPALAGYIEVRNVNVFPIYSAPGSTSVDTKRHSFIF